MRFLTSPEDRTVGFDADGMALPRPRAFWAGSITVYSAITIITYVKFAISVRKNISKVGCVAVLGIFLSYPLVLVLLIWKIPVNPFYTEELADDYTAYIMFRSLPHFACMLLTPCIALFPDCIEMMIEMIREDSHDADARTPQLSGATGPPVPGPAGAPLAGARPSHSTSRPSLPSLPESSTIEYGQPPPASAAPSIAEPAVPTFDGFGQA